MALTRGEPYPIEKLSEIPDGSVVVVFTAGEYESYHTHFVWFPTFHDTNKFLATWPNETETEENPTIVGVAEIRSVYDIEPYERVTSWAIKRD